jgi:hypothetical protein
MRHTTFRFALDPTPVQEEMLARHAGTSRFAYNQCLRFVTDALTRKRLDPSVNVPWSGYDLINAFNTWKKSENAGRVFIVSPDGTVAAGSDGTEVGRWPANDPLRRRLRRLRRRSRALSRTRYGSRKRVEAAGRLAREHAHIADARRTFLHQVSRTLPSTTSSATTALLGPSATPHGRNLPVSSGIKPDGSAQTSWFVTAGTPRVGPARGVEPRRSG